MAPSLEDAVKDGLGEIRVVQDPTLGRQRLVGGENHRAPVQVAVVDNLELTTWNSTFAASGP